jgi:hypothetical protein
MKEDSMKCPVLLSVLLLLAPPVAGQCVAFLAPPTVVLFADEAGKTRQAGIRSVPVVLMPALKRTMKLLPSVKITDRITFTEFAACRGKDALRNEESGLTKFWMEMEGDTFAPVWGKETELNGFEYQDPGPYKEQRRTANMRLVHHGLDLMLDRVKNADFKPPEIENQRTFPQDFDKIWTALIETLSDQQWPLETIDKASGLVTTKTMTDSKGETMVCATKFDEAHRTSLNLFVKKTENGTRVKVNATFRAVREDQAISCYSSGAIEKAIFDGIKKNL